MAVQNTNIWFKTILARSTWKLLESCCYNYTSTLTERLKNRNIYKFSSPELELDFSCNDNRHWSSCWGSQLLWEKSVCLSDVIPCTLQWRQKSPASWWFAQPVDQAQIKENIIAPRDWPSWREFAGHFPSQRASNAENVSIWWRHNETDRNRTTTDPMTSNTYPNESETEWPPFCRRHVQTYFLYEYLRQNRQQANIWRNTGSVSDSYVHVCHSALMSQYVDISVIFVPLWQYFFM